MASPDQKSDSLADFHPAIAEWFRRTLGEPTDVQVRAWAAIAGRRALSGLAAGDDAKTAANQLDEASTRQPGAASANPSHTLIAAPTGSGKTLAAFLTILNDLVVKAFEGELAQETSVLYVSPLKALSNDVEKNLSRPLREIQDAIFQTHLRRIDIQVAVRTGDTPAGERAAMIKTNPHILITTPESLFLLLTSRRGREMLRNVKTVIVDEIHAMVQEKRGAHLSLSLERLQALAGSSLVRIGLSATQSPISEVARFLTGLAGPGPTGPDFTGPDQGNTDVSLDASPAAVDTRNAPVTQAFPECTIIDAGHRRRMDLQVEIPASPLTAVMAGEVWDEVYTRIEALIAEHKTTLVFVNTRRLAERVAHRLSQSLGEDKVAAHHGSLSKDRRFSAEQRLKSGDLRALVATASLELGIDIGSVDLVIQIACPKSISAFLQRVGRSGHSVGALPKGRLFPLTRDELIEAAALLDAVRRGELDTLSIPEKPLDILSQQIVAETACREWRGDDLFRLFKRAYPYRNLERGEFQELVDMLAQGFTTRRGRRGAHLHLDGINDRLRGRPGARLTALTNGGAIPDTFDYDVKLDPGNTLLGSVNEDFAIESIPGDIFQLGNNSWQILRVEGSTVRVADAHGQPPTLPFWLGEAPGRSEAFSNAVSRLREEISARLGETSVLQERVEDQGSGPGAQWRRAPLDWLIADVGLCEGAADQLVDYLASAKLSLGVMPSRSTLVLERFFDEAGDMHMVLHAPFGSRVNRAWGLSLRKRFCRKFNFELQAAATEEGLILSLGATHSFPLEEVFQYLRAASVRPILIQALLDAPMFEVRWRWNATRALALQRNRNGKKVPPQLQRMAAEDLVSLIFPDSKACFENIQGEREVPDHPLVRQTIDDCLHEAMDIDGLERLLGDMEGGRLTLEARDLKEPSPLAQEIIHARPYAFLDDAPLEERRTRAIVSGRNGRWLDPAAASDIGRLDPQAIAAVRAEAWPQARTPDELHDALMLTGFLTEIEISGWRSLLESLQSENRVASLRANPDAHPIWIAAERIASTLIALPGAVMEWAPILPARPRTPSTAGSLSEASSTHSSPSTCSAAKTASEEEALVELIRGRMEALGPTRNIDVTVSLGIPSEKIEYALLALEQEGFILRGRFTPAAASSAPSATSSAALPVASSREPGTTSASPAETSPMEPSVKQEATSSADAVEWCERRLLARIHRYTLAKLRREIEPVSAADFMRFLFSWHGLVSSEAAAPATGLPQEGPEAVEAILSKLEGFEAPCGAWEIEIFPARLSRYESAWLDLQGLSGDFIWGRVRPGNLPQGVEGRMAPRSIGPVNATPIAFLGRQNLSLWLEGFGLQARDLAPEPEGAAKKVLDHLRNRGASFWKDILWDTGLPPADARDAIAELVSLGWLTSDGFRGLRALLPAQPTSPSSHSTSSASDRNPSTHLDRSGRWSLLRPGNSDAGESTMARTRDAHSPELEMAARTLLQRYGIVFRKLADRENLMPPWRDLVRALRLLEARGEIRGGRFVEGFYGEQFALPEALNHLRQIRKREKKGALISLSAADPANLQGLLTPGPRIPALRRNRILFRDGEPIAALEGGEVRILGGVEPTSSDLSALRPRNVEEARPQRVASGI